MVIVRLKGLAKATKRLASGEKRVYWYAWRGGPQLQGEPGTPEFMQSHADALAKRKADLSAGDDIRALIREFEKSTDYPTSAASVKAYQSYLPLIEKKFGTMPIKALKEAEVRGVFLRWRDEFKKTPRKADYIWTVLGRLMSFAVNRGYIKTNPCARAGRLAESGTRIDITWTDETLERLFAVATWEVALVCFAALWTGQRQGDVLAWKRSNIQDGVLRFTQGKRQKGKPPKKIAMPVPSPLALALKRAPKGEALFLNSRGEPWTSDGFRSSLARTMEKAGIEDDVRFHDMRGTFSSAAGDAGASEPEISAVTGHALPGRSALSSAYLKRSLVMATSCVRLVEEHKAGTIWFTAMDKKEPGGEKKRKPALQTVANLAEKCQSQTKTPAKQKRSDLSDLGSVVGDVGLEPTTR